MDDANDLHRGYCYDYGAGWAEITSCFETSPLGVELHREGSGVLNFHECRRLAAFLNKAADWLEKTRRNSGSPIGTLVYLISDSHEHFKVGKAVNVATRIKQLQTGNGRRLRLTAYLPCSSEGVAYRAETFVKRWLKPYRASGEWFKCDGETAVMALYEAAESLGFGYTPIQMQKEVANGTESR